jgi:preprotein translocase subunit Sec63
VAANSRTFDAVFTCRGGLDYSFSNLNKEELPFIEAFLRDKKIKFQNELVAKKPAYSEGADDSAGSDSDASAPVRSGDDMDEDSSTDEDYQEGDDETQGSGSGSSSDAEDSEGSAVDENDD